MKQYDYVFDTFVQNMNLCTMCVYIYIYMYQYIIV